MSETPFSRATIRNKGDNTYEVPDSFNVSSIVDEGTGKIGYNFASVAANSEYTISHSAQPLQFGTTVQVDPDQEPTTSGFTVIASVTPDPPLPQSPRPVDVKRLFITVNGVAA